MNKRTAIKELKRLEKVDKEQRMEINQIKEDLNNTQEELNNTQEKLKYVEKVQDQQGIDLAALAKALNEMEDKKIVFEDQYAENQDKYNKIMKLIEENPDIEHELNRNRVLQSRDEKCQKSKNIIDEKIDNMNKVMNDFFKFVQNNYKNI